MDKESYKILCKKWRFWQPGPGSDTWYMCIHPYTRVTWRGQAKGFAGKGPQRGSLGYAGVQWRDVGLRAIFKT